MYANNAQFVSRSLGSLANMTTIIVTTSGAFDPTVAKKKTETMCMRGPDPMVESLKIEAA